MSDSSQNAVADSEKFACDVQTAEDEAEENLQNALGDNEEHMRVAFQRAASSVCRLARCLPDRDQVIVFQEAATAVTRLYKATLTYQKKLLELSRRCGQLQRHREVYDNIRKAGNARALSLVAGCMSTSLGTAARGSRALSPDVEEAKHAGAPAVDSGPGDPVFPAGLPHFNARRRLAAHGVTPDDFFDDYLSAMSLGPRKRHHADDDVDLFSEGSPKRKRH